MVDKFRSNQIIANGVKERKKKKESLEPTVNVHFH